ncbi:ABC transporter substrate-binding protein [Gordonia sp. CPCC 206044]|uniref:ABC transporter substrate-binding protein n=1 Tax=Gordonia sp. CPCC 206044 TaxID=3140793 RepID=UPI003AF37B29
MSDARHSLSADLGDPPDRVDSGCRNTGRKTRVRRRTLAAVFAAVALFSTATACGTDDGAADTATSTRSITDAQGRTVDVPSEAKRVVTLSEPTIDAAVALGVEPVGITAGRGQQGAPTYIADRVDGVPVVATVGAANLEQIAGLRPDLILLDETTSAKKNVDQLAAIAPTVVTAELKADWRQAFLNTADALGRRGQAQGILASFDEKVTDVKGRLGPDAGASVSVIRWQNAQPSTIGQAYGHVGMTIAALGLTRPQAQQGDGPGHSVPVSPELMDDIDADWMFFGTLGDKASGQAALDEAKTLPTFARLTVVGNDHVRAVDGSAWNSAGGPIAAGLVLDDLTTAMAAG